MGGVRKHLKEIEREEKYLNKYGDERKLRDGRNHGSKDLNIELEMEEKI